MTDKTLGAYQRHEKTITDRGGDVLTLSTGHPSARTDEVTVHVREHFRGRTHSAAVHVTPRDLRAALDEFDPVRECPDLDAHWRLDEAMDRAERAERERDEWKDSAIKAMADLERAEHPRSLTPDAVTDAMIERARQRGSEIVGALWDASVVEAMLTAALTEPPARPEELTRLIDTIRESTYDPEPVATGEALYNAGVRVVTEEQQ